MTGRRSFLVALAFAVVGCASKTTPPSTMAKDKAAEFYDAIRVRDWPRAYGAIHPNGRRDQTVETFARLAERYRRSIGFEPEQVQVTSCDEHGDTATAHIVFTGHSALRQRFKDGIMLQRDGESWGVMLPGNFGR